MGIFDRMGKVISGNLNALIDGAEDDRKLVSLNIEEQQTVGKLQGPLLRQLGGTAAVSGAASPSD